MVSKTIKIKNKNSAYEAWDKESVIIREVDNFVYVYPMLGRGYSYYGFNLRQECNLMGFSNLDQAVLWAQSRGYFVHVVS